MIKQYKILNDQIVFGSFNGLHEGFQPLPEEFHNIDNRFIIIDTDGNLIIDPEMSSKLDYEKKEALLETLMSTHQEKLKARKNYINGEYLTPEQYELYKTKTKLAKEVIETGIENPIFQNEATMFNMTITELANVIITLDNQAMEAYETYAITLDGLRIFIKNLIKSGDLTNGEIKLNEYKENINETSTEEEIAALMSI